MGGTAGAFAAGLALGAAAGAAGAAWAARRRRKELGRFVSFAAHEINTPITAVNMTVLNLLSGVFGPLDPEKLPWVTLMREQMVRLNAIIGELRDLIHMELDKELLLRSEPAETADMLDAAAKSVVQGLQQAGAALEVDAAGAPPLVLGDPDRLQRTLTSLLFHAKKFRSTGPVRLSARREGGAAVFEVSFEGPALPPDEARRSLDAFYPARALKQTMTATGTGLGVLRLILRRQGGDLDLRVEGKRNRLLMTVPLAPAPAAGK
jgi:signal transduction histidine kinase